MGDLLRLTVHIRLIVVGYANAEEKGDAEKLAALRAIPTKDYLTKGVGKLQIDAGPHRDPPAPAATRARRSSTSCPKALASPSDTVVVDENQLQGKPGEGK